MGKSAVLLSTSTDEGGRTVNGLEYAASLDESGNDVEVFLDGQATEWPGAVGDAPNIRYAPNIG